MSQEDIAFLDECITTGTRPNDLELRRLFPRPFKILEELGLPVSRITMEFFWHIIHRGPHEATPTSVTILKRRAGRTPEGMEYWTTIEDRLVHNYRRIHVHEDDVVWVHDANIAEHA
jgi:hypothetical protein